MNLINIGRQFALNGEGLRLEVYLDTATPPKATWGIGRNLTDKPLNQAELDTLALFCPAVREARAPLSLAETTKILCPSLGKIDAKTAEAFAGYLCEAELKACDTSLELTHPGYPNLNYPRRAVLLDMCYNMGPAFWHDWPNFTASVIDGRWSDASRAMLDSRWAKQVHDYEPNAQNPRGGRAWYLAKTMQTGTLPGWIV